MNHRINFDKYNWTEIQKDYDSGLTWRDIQKKYKVNCNILGQASKKGLFVSRTRVEAFKLGLIRKPRKLTQETKDKISVSRKKFLLENPDKVPYLLNHKHKRQSYPEKYFSECFKNSIIISKHRILTYELDFAVPDRKIDIEIDGEQHFSDPRIVEHDIKRNRSLTELGWTIFRIRWSKFKSLSDERKSEVVKSILELNPIVDNSILIIDANINSDKLKQYMDKQELKAQVKCDCGQLKYFSSKFCRKCTNLNRILRDAPTEEELILLLHTISIKEMTERFNVHRGKIHDWAHYYNITVPKFPKGYWERRKNGQSHDQALIIKPKPSPAKRITREQIVIIQQMLDNKIPHRTIEKEVGISRRTIYKYIKIGKLKVWSDMLVTI